MSVVRSTVGNWEKGTSIEEDPTEKELWAQLPTSEGQERAEVLLQLAQQAVFRDAGTEALALAEEAWEVCSKLGATASNTLVAETFKGIGNSLKELNMVKDAAHVLDRAIAIEREGQFPFLPDTLRTQALWYMDVNEYALAEQSYIEAIMVNEVNSVEEFMAYDLYNLGVCYYKQSRFVDAIESYQKARVLLKKLKKVDKVAMCDQRIAESFVEIGSGIEAADYARRAYDVADLTDSAEWKCKSAFALGKAFNVKGEFEEALTWLKDAEGRVSCSSDWEMMVAVQKEIALTLRQLNRFSEANEVERRLTSIEEILN